MRGPTLGRVLALVAAGLAGAIVVLLATGPTRLPTLGRADLDAARERWRRAGVPSYRLVVVMEGSELERGRYEVLVEGSAARVTRNGIPVTGDPAAWSVDGLLDLLAQELALAEDPQRNLGAPAGYSAHLAARFEDARGVPLRFRRVVGGGRSRTVEWSVESFEPLR